MVGFGANIPLQQQLQVVYRLALSFPPLRFPAFFLLATFLVTGCESGSTLFTGSSYGVNEQPLEPGFYTSDQPANAETGSRGEKAWAVAFNRYLLSFSYKEVNDQPYLDVLAANFSRERKNNKLSGRGYYLLVPYEASSDSYGGNVEQLSFSIAVREEQSEGLLVLSSDNYNLLNSQRFRAEHSYFAPIAEDRLNALADELCRGAAFTRQRLLHRGETYAARIHCQHSQILLTRFNHPDLGAGIHLFKVGRLAGNLMLDHEYRAD